MSQVEATILAVRRRYSPSLGFPEARLVDGDR